MLTYTLSEKNLSASVLESDKWCGHVRGWVNFILDCIGYLTLESTTLKFMKTL
jgi:hypothetical protein